MVTTEQLHVVGNEIKTDWIQEEKPWYLLPGTGFDVELQVDMLAKDIRQGLENGEKRGQIIERWLDQTEQDIQGFKVEYLCEGLLFPIVLEKQTVKGKTEIVAPLYGGKKLIDTVSERERNGAVKRSVERVREFLLSATPGSIAVMTSPPGWSGIEGITYPDSQTYIWQVQKNGNVRGFTVRTDMNSEQNKELLEAFGVERKDLNGVNEQEELTKIVSKPVFLHGEEKVYEIEDVVRVIAGIKGDFAHQDKGFDEVYEQLKNPESLWLLDSTTQKLVKEFREFVWQEIQNGEGNRRENIQKALGITVLKLAEKIRKISPQVQEVHFSENDTFKVQEDRYKAALYDMRKIGGCNGGGEGTGIGFGGSGIIVDSITPRYGLPSFENKKNWIYKTGDCVVCKEKEIQVGPCKICKKCEKKFD